MESEDEFEETHAKTQQSLVSTPKLKLDLCTGVDHSKGLFKFFPKISCEEHLQHAWIPFSWELKDQEQDHHQQQFDKFEKAARKQERAAEHKIKHMQTCNLGQKRKQEGMEALCVNWQSPLLWPTIEMAALCVGYAMSLVEIECELKQVDPTHFCRISAQLIGSWIDHHSGMQPVWHVSVLACVQKGNLPLTTATPPGILSKYPNVMKTIIEDLHSLRTVSVALDTMCCRGVIITHLMVSCPDVFEVVAKDGSHF
ncbi:uncharacterized protein BJ212DRAFT_1305651 [Suillus subaureus]|uniref:Uncharacterized protein n=1 Tax=Suillus subaureus TaxID=48587 RepID=A0A9P7J1D4_9AGAM|nr:uncharacterized protein BJ212DRAFT_1305651 [Suillus subaureus]KAG1798791.1 hypothetical protein BJ212DRAFT_1305651 [Suillus subaureus]